MTYVLIFSVAIAAGLLAWAVTSVMLKLRHWYENEMDRWNDFLRGWRQFFEGLQPLLFGATVAVVAGLLALLSIKS
jgi:hypothetical protein